MYYYQTVVDILLVILEILAFKISLVFYKAPWVLLCAFPEWFWDPGGRCLVLRLETDILKLGDFSPRLSQIPGFNGKVRHTGPPSSPPRSCRCGLLEWRCRRPSRTCVFSSAVSTISCCPPLRGFLHGLPAGPPVLLSLHSLFPRWALRSFVGCVSEICSLFRKRSCGCYLLCM